VLVLTRKVNQGITIAVGTKRIRMMITGLVGASDQTQVRLGFEADDDVRIWRDEIQAEIDAERQQ
jgi:carbon storage regulator CsrA